MGAWLLCALSCTSTREGSLGVDVPIDEDDDAGPAEQESTFPDVQFDYDADVPTADAQPSPGVPVPPPRDAQVSRDAKAPAAPQDAAVAMCTPGGHRPFEGVAQPGDRDWDGGLPSLLDPSPPRLDPSPPVLPPPLGYEAGVPPFCCTLMTPWFCMPLSPGP